RSTAPLPRLGPRSVDRARCVHRPVLHGLFPPGPDRKRRAPGCAARAGCGVERPRPARPGHRDGPGGRIAQRCPHVAGGRWTRSWRPVLTATTDAVQAGDHGVARLGRGETTIKELFVPLAAVGLIVWIWLITPALKPLFQSGPWWRGSGRSAWKAPRSWP